MVALRALRAAVRTGNGWVFESPKAKFPLPVAHGLVFDALVRFALDSSVREIRAAPPEASLVAGVHCFIAARCDVSTLVCVCVGPLPRGWLGSIAGIAGRIGLSILPLDRADLCAEPLASNCRKVWSCRRHRVDAGDRYRIIALMREEVRLPLAEVCSEVRSGSDPLSVISTLACEGVLALDLASAPLDARTAVALSAEGIS
jgi:hypothetical protein